MERGSRCTPEGLSAAAIAMRNRPDYTKVLKESSIPLLMVAGRFDAGIPVSTSALQASLSANASFYILESSGHSGMLEESDKSAEILQEFTNHCQLYTNEN